MNANQRAATGSAGIGLFSGVIGCHAQLLFVQANFPMFELQTLLHADRTPICAVAG